ncbi:MAG TPA: hypothetical protein VLR90_12120 [Blastocatellia bacterium]|jgi:hypothetical protein|nr:hypothetical protein [Blastocatellia bacterium]HST21861.1 hypothetical protein [Blastocatellia bacterium]
MMEGNVIAPADALIHLLRSSLRTDGSQPFTQVVLYTSFGVVRGRIGYAFAQVLKEEQISNTNPFHAVIELDDVVIEHYSNHLPKATFNRLYVRLNDVQGFALI